MVKRTKNEEEMKKILIISVVLFFVSCSKPTYIDNKPLTGFRNGVYYEYSHSLNRIEPLSFSNRKGDTITTIVDTLWLREIQKKKKKISWTVNVPLFDYYPNYYDTIGQTNQELRIKQLYQH